MPSKPCVACSRSIPIFSAGKCHKCFAAWGVENDVPEEQMPQSCPVDGCDSYVMRRGYCDRHYRRFIDHGTTEKVRVVNEERLHPEYKNWQWLKRQGKLCEDWQLFHVYLEAVGDRPSSRHWADRPNTDALYGPGNFQWAAPKLDAEFTQVTREGRQAYQQALRAQEPRYWVGENLRRYFGITRDQYAELLAAQGGTCALCDKTEDNVDGKPRLLSVDHRHSDGLIRGLLCHSCNVGLGHFRDDPEALRCAARYLETSDTGLFAPVVGDVTQDIRRRGFSMPGEGKTCSVDGCENASKAQGLCPTHYSLFMRNGTTERKRTVLVCTTEGCDHPIKAKGLCNTHYEYAYRHGTLPPSEPSMMLICSMEGCETPAKARGLCMTHYKRWSRHGSPDVVHTTQGELLSDPSQRTPNASSG